MKEDLIRLELMAQNLMEGCNGGVTVYRTSKSIEELSWVFWKPRWDWVAPSLWRYGPFQMLYSSKSRVHGFFLLLLHCKLMMPLWLPEILIKLKEFHYWQISTGDYEDAVLTWRGYLSLWQIYKAFMRPDVDKYVLLVAIGPTVTGLALALLIRPYPSEDFGGNHRVNLLWRFRLTYVSSRFKRIQEYWEA